MSEEMKSIKGVKVSDVFDYRRIAFPASWTSTQIMVCGRALRNYDDMKAKIDSLIDMVAKHESRADELYDALEKCADALEKSCDAMDYPADGKSRQEIAAKIARDVLRKTHCNAPD